MTQLLIEIWNKEATDCLINETVEEIGFEAVAFAIALLWNIPKNALCPTIDTIPILKKRYDDPLRLVRVIE
jgi:hypothetical protein